MAFTELDDATRDLVQGAWDELAGALAAARRFEDAFLESRYAARTEGISRALDEMSGVARSELGRAVLASETGPAGYFDGLGAQGPGGQEEAARALASRLEEAADAVFMALDVARTGLRRQAEEAGRLADIAAEALA